MSVLKLKTEHSELLAVRSGVQATIDQMYKASIALANSGQKDIELESKLPQEFKNLLDARRFIFQRDFKKAQSLLEKSCQPDFLLEADRFFLLGHVAFNSGDMNLTNSRLKTAANFYRQINDEYRETRALVNAEICIANLVSCQTGALFTLEQVCYRNNYPDLIALISSARSIELLREGYLIEARIQADKASELFKQAGYSDDRAVSQMISAIASIALGDLNQAIAKQRECLVQQGKVKNYLMVFDCLLNSKKPQIPQGHPLSIFDWKKIIIKTDSIPGKIISQLKQSPKTRDQLIFSIWGENALDESYCSRLHSAIHDLRTKRGLHIIFNGEMYELLG